MRNFLRNIGNGIRRTAAGVRNRVRGIRALPAPSRGGSGASSG